MLFYKLLTSILSSNKLLINYFNILKSLLSNKIKMSFTKINNKSNTSNSNINKKPYCKVCHDAGKEEAIYTSHYVKSEPGPKGKVVCPTLLEQVCKCCLKKGHTITYCSEIKKQDKMDKKNNYNNNKDTSTSLVKVPKLKNKFELLQDSDSEEEDYKVVKNKNIKNIKNNKNIKEEFPALTSQSTLKTKTSSALVNHFQVSYAEMANKGHEIAQKEEILTEIYESKVKAQETKKPVILVAKKKRIIVEKKKRNWADYSSDEDDDEDDDFNEVTEYEYYEPRNTSEIQGESYQCYEY